MAYLPLSTANLPDPVIDPAKGSSPEDYFNTVLYTSTSANQSITGVGFEPDLCWIKDRTDANSHHLFDQVRGAGERLRSDSTAAENTVTSFSSFDTDGFTLGPQGQGITTNNNNHVSWNWKANGSGVSNTDGSITSTVSASTESGFSIVKFTDAGSAGTVGHGLGVKPDLIIQKPLSGNNDWYVFTEVIDGSFDFLNLNTTGAKNNSTLSAPTSAVFSNLQISGDCIAYCFHSVEAFSKFGSYTGNGSTDGPFVYTGFRPAFVMVKATNSTQSWVILDNERAGYNVNNYRLFAESSNAESTTTPIVDLLSNGFKWRNNFGNFNGSGTNYIYMAFAEQPVKFSNAR